MRRHALTALVLTALANPAPAEAKPPVWTACQVSHGVLVVPAQAAGLTGMFILDTATALSVIDATQATLAGLSEGQATVPVRLGGRRWGRMRMSIAPLDARTSAQPTPITGVLGADALDGLALEVWPDPCRFRLTSRRPSPARPALASLPIVRRGGGFYVLAGVSDGERARRGLMRIATGQGHDAVLSPDAARLEGAPSGAADPTGPLRALSLGDALVETMRSGIAADPSPGALGDIGEPVWSRYGFRLDLRRDRLTLFQAPAHRARPRRSGGS